MKCYYEADDGTIFENMENCLKYEEEQKKKYKFESIFRDWNGKKIPFLREDGTDNYENIDYVTIINSKEAEQLDEVFNEIGGTAANFSQNTLKSYPQNYYYDIGNEKWESFDNLKNRYLQLAKIFEED